MLTAQTEGMPLCKKQNKDKDKSNLDQKKVQPKLDQGNDDKKLKGQE